MIAERIQIVVQDEAADAPKPSAAWIESCARLALDASAGAAVGAASAELTIRIVDASESAELNQRYRNRVGPTNVLAFPPGDLPDLGDDEPVPLGDLAVCAPVVAAESAAQGKTLDAHWAHIVIHGCLHLVGFDHSADADAEQMEGRERALLAAIGIDDPYRPIDGD